jgi:hypothetical protein
VGSDSANLLLSQDRADAVHVSGFQLVMPRKSARLRRVNPLPATKPKAVAPAIAASIYCMDLGTAQ